MPWHQTVATQYHTQLGLQDKGRAIKGLVVCNNWFLEPLDLLNGLALGCYQPSPVVWLVCMILLSFKNLFSNFKEEKTVFCTYRVDLLLLGPILKRYYPWGVHLTTSHNPHQPLINIYLSDYETFYHSFTFILDN